MMGSNGVEEIGVVPAENQARIAVEQAALTEKNARVQQLMAGYRSLSTEELQAMLTDVGQDVNAQETEQEPSDGGNVREIEQAIRMLLEERETEQSQI